MKFSKRWIEKLTKLSINNYDFKNKLINLGMEINSINPVGEKFSGVVVGFIINCITYYNNKKLKIIEIDIGNKKILKIISSLNNCKPGIYVAVAIIKSSLPNNLNLKLININGIKLEGCICTFKMLGILNYGDKIIEFSDNIQLGTNVYNYLQFNDSIIDISIASNRSDCLSVLGISRDILILYNKKYKINNIKTINTNINDSIPVKVLSKNECPSYIIRIINNININILTPLWIKERLRRCGIKSINVIIDITNYLLLEFGQPIHVFNKDIINKGLIVRYAKSGEFLNLLNKKKIILSKDTLIVSDYEKPLSIAGIIGDIISCINNNTKNIILECAHFIPSVFVGKGNKYKLHTESLYRFERGVDYNLPLFIIEKATNLIISICGGNVGPIININNDSFFKRKKNINLRYKKIYNLIGYKINKSIINNILICIGCNILTINYDLNVIPPSWRFDLNIEEDLISEITRIYGYNLIPMKPAYISQEIKYITKKNYLIYVKQLLINRDYNEVINYSFVDNNIQKNIYPNINSILLKDPISLKMSSMRVSLLIGLLNTLKYNQNRQQTRIRLFESGFCFSYNNNYNLGVSQNFILSGIITGSRYKESWNCKNIPVDFYDIKGDVESILNYITYIDKITFKFYKNTILNNNISSGIFLNNDLIGFIGKLNFNIENIFNIKNVFIFELFWNKIYKKRKYKINKISKFPINRRDISIIVSEDVLVSDIISECKKKKFSTIVDIKVFDLYYGKNIKKGFKSISLSFILLNNNLTLKDIEINQIISKYIKILNKKFNILLRD